jgi:hypothetical protein
MAYLIQQERLRGEGKIFIEVGGDGWKGGSV